MRQILYFAFLVISALALVGIRCSGGSIASNGGSSRATDDDASPAAADDDSSHCAGTSCQSSATCFLALGQGWFCEDNCCAQALPADDDDNDTGESVWTDPTTGYMWQNGQSVGTASFEWNPWSYEDPETYCTELGWAGYGDWLLPDINLLRSLIRGCDATATGGSCGVTNNCNSDLWPCWSNSCDGCSNLGGPAMGGAYWPAEITGNITAYWTSLTDSTDSMSVWGVDFNFAALVTIGEESDSASVRCVRFPMGLKSK
jgi:hypothetical protein